MLETTAAVKLEQAGDGFAITHSDLTLKAEVPGISQEQFDALAAGAKGELPGVEAAQRRDHAQPYAGLRILCGNPHPGNGNPLAASTAVE